MATDLPQLIHDYHTHIGRKQLHNVCRLLQYFIRFNLILRKDIINYTYRDMESFIGYLLEEGLTQEQIAGEFQYLRKFYDYLCDNNIVTINIAREVFAHANKNEPRKRTNAELMETFKAYHPRK